MRRRNHKSFIFMFLLAFCAGGVFLYLTGCSDNPEAKAAKEMRKKTTDAVEMSVGNKEYKNGKEQIQSLLEPNRSKVKGLTKDAALLASGNLALAQGQQMQAELGLKTLQVQQNADALEKTLRDAEQFLIEKEKVESLLKSSDEQVSHLQQLLDGDGQKEGLRKQLELAESDMQKLSSGKAALEEDQQQTQAILDEHQTNADDLKRQAELASGDQRLKLEQQAYTILQQCKDYYTKVQSIENDLGLLDSDITLGQVRVDGLTQSIQNIQQQIEAIEASQVRVSLKQQIQEIEKNIADGRERLGSLSSTFNTAMSAYREAVNQICTVYDEAVSEFSKVASRDAGFITAVRLADSAHYAAVTNSSLIRTQKYLANRFKTLLDSADEQFRPLLQSQLQLAQEINAEDANKTFAYFDRSIEAYDNALSAVSGLSRNLKQEDRSKAQDAECSLMKSKLLALHSKMQLADLLEEYDLANSTETALNELIQKGTELGVCFTQSEAMNVVEKGLKYFPSLPLDMEAFAEGKKQELSAWKGLPLEEQEAAVDKNVQQIDELIAKYGDEIAQQLNPLKQEMLAAKERGFKEVGPGGSTPGEPNSLF